MKKIFTLLLIAATLCSCSDDDSPKGDANLSGSWNMVSYIAYMDTLPVLEDGDITWTFNNAGTHLVIINKVDEEYPYIIKSGTYTVSAHNGMMKIDGQPYRYSLSDGKLILPANDEVGDGPAMTFEAIQD